MQRDNLEAAPRGVLFSTRMFQEGYEFPALDGVMFAAPRHPYTQGLIRSIPRIDLAAVRQPDQPFNNFGGMNLWPAPEGGPFGFNYEGSRWYVQPAINVEPFTSFVVAITNRTRPLA